MSKKREISAALLGVCVALILWITILGREPQPNGRIFYPPFHSITTMWRDIWHVGIRSNFLGNIALFVPVGVLLPLTTGWKWKTVTVGCIFSIIVETIQLVTVRGCFDLDDVVLNTIGCIIGFVLLLFCTATKKI